MSYEPPLRATFVVGALFGLGLVVGATGYAAAARTQDPYERLDRFASVLTRIRNGYVEELSTDVLVDAAIAGMVDHLDEHSRWMSPEEARSLEDDTDGEYEGIGIEVRLTDDRFVIWRVLSKGPAEFAGLNPGDQILTVDGESVHGLSLDDLATRLKGPRGEPVFLGILREGWIEPQEIPAVRDRIHSPPVEGELFPGRIAYVHLSAFQRGASDELELMIDTLGGDELSGLVLDLRDNPGGRLEEAVAVADLFLDDGIIVSTRGRIEGALEFEATSGGVAAGLPVVVLVNGNSASASEIVGGALQDTGRAVLVGEHTWGKGSVQTVYTYPDGSALKLTIAHYYTPSGEPVAPHRGRQPDHVVPLAPEFTPTQALRERIAALPVSDAERSELEALLAQLPEAEPAMSQVPWALRGAARIEADPPLAKALDLLAQMQ